MSASATIPPTPLTVEPGSEVSVFVQVRNTGEIVDQYTFEVLGEAAQWAKLDPPELSLFPGAEGEIKVSFAPPREATTQSGEIPFGLKVVSKEDPEDSVVEEGLLEVGTYADLGAELLPRTSRGRLAGKHELAFDNRGNRRINAQLTAADPDNKLRFRFSPPALVSPPGTAVFAKVAVRPKRKFLWGRPKTYPFKVFIESEGETPLAVDGTIFQEQLIPKWSTALVARRRHPDPALGLPAPAVDPGHGHERGRQEDSLPAETDQRPEGARGDGGRPEGREQGGEGGSRGDRCGGGREGAVRDDAEAGRCSREGGRRRGRSRDAREGREQHGRSPARHGLRHQLLALADCPEGQAVPAHGHRLPESRGR